MKHILTLILLLATLSLSAQSYSPCYTNNIAKGDAAFKQGRYSEAKTYYANAKKCAGGNPSAAQQKISECERKLNPCKSMKDIEGNVYKTVQIGIQCWMTENMRTTRDNTGMPLFHDQKTANPSGSAYYCPDSYCDTALIQMYGYEYTFSAAEKICPNGWHLPTEKDWKMLFDYCGTKWSVGGDKRNIAKSLCSSDGWEESSLQYAVGHDEALNNASGFNARPFQTGIVGCPMIENNTEKSGQIAMFWSCPLDYDINAAFYANFKCFYYDYPQSNRPPDLDAYCTWWMPVRCVRN